ncbi:MAG TPA: hypothetical protein VHG51_17810 [Longimicrobiaceae bacterium]|nr:hypothetical protein [Longimicrobiaceae bacterium]
MSTTEAGITEQNWAADQALHPETGTPVGAGTTGSEGEGLATFLAWFSIGLGTMQVAAPRRMTRLIGLRPTRQSSTVMQAMGLREIGHGVAILRDPGSATRVGARVGGDALDLALLGVALANSERPMRTLLAVGAVLGVTVLDVLGTKRAA